MADDIKWIRMKVGMFDGNSFKKIKRAKIGGVQYRDKLTAVWFELLDLAAKSNKNGYLIDNNAIPYQTFDDIATQIDREEKEVELCMQFFESEKMIEFVDGMYCVANFVQYQNQDGLAQIRENNRLRQARFKEKKRALLLEENNGNVTDNTDNVTITLPSRYSNALDKELDKEKDSLLKMLKNKESIAGVYARGFKTELCDEILNSLVYGCELTEPVNLRGVYRNAEDFKRVAKFFDGEALCETVNAILPKQNEIKDMRYYILGVIVNRFMK